MKRKMRDRANFFRNVTSQDEFGDNEVDSTSDLGTFWCKLDHDSGEVNQEFAGENQIKTDFTLYLRKLSASSIQKGDYATLETPNVTIQINSIVEHDLQTIKMTGSSVA